MNIFRSTMIISALLNVAFLPLVASAQSAASPFTKGYRYDAAGRTTGAISPDPDGTGPLHYAAIRNTYDAAGRLIRVETGELAGWQSEQVAPISWAQFTVYHQLDTTYDGLNRKLVDKVSSVVNGAATPQALTQYSYDVDNHLQCTAVRMNSAAYGSLPADACTLGVQGSNGPDRITKNVYDDRGEIVQVIKAYGVTTANGFSQTLQQAYQTYSYTPNGKQQDVVDANGNHAKMLYDGFDRASQWQFPSATSAKAYDGSTQANALSSANAVNTNDYEAYGYDANGNRTTLRKRDGRVFTYGYDVLNRLTSKALTTTSCTSTCTAAASTALRSVYYGYDLENHQLYARYDSASGGDGVVNGYDGYGELTGTTTSLGGFSKSMTFLFDADGNRTRVTHPDGNYFQYGYDGLDRLNAITENGGTAIATETYDAQAHPVAETRGGVASTYGYDGLERLASLTDDLAGTSADVTTTFGYNAASQITSQTRTNDAYAFTAATNVSRSYIVNGLNQYTSVSNAGYNYDSNGNLTADGTYSYLYDAENRLVGTTSGATLGYDTSGRLVRAGNGTQIRFLLYDGDKLTGEYDSSYSLIRRYVHGTGDDNPLVWYEGAGLGDRRSLQVDHQGSIVSVADSLGNMTAINGYDEYGVPNGGNVGRFQYTGQIWLGDLTGLGLYHYKARAYSPQLGRFMQTDPVGYKDQMDLYAYVANDPVNNLDHNGQEIGRAAKDLLVDPNKPQPNVDPAGALANIIDAATIVGVTVETALSAGTTLAGPDEVEIAAERAVTAGMRGGEEQSVATADRTAGSALRRDAHGVPRPDPEAVGRPHTQLGVEQGRRGSYRQTREFDPQGRPVRDRDFTDHGRSDHPNPHQHEWVPNPTGGSPRRGPAKPFDE